MHVFSKRSFLCRHIAGIGSIFLTGFLPGICSKFLSGFLPKFLVHIPGRIPARNLVQIPGRIPANLNISLQIPQGVHTDSCRNLYKKNQIVKGIPARNLVSFSCGNTAVFLLDNFVRDAEEYPHIDCLLFCNFKFILKKKNVSLVRKIFNLQSYSLFLGVFPPGHSLPFFFFFLVKSWDLRKERN